MISILQDFADQEYESQIEIAVSQSMRIQKQA